MLAEMNHDGHASGTEVLDECGSERGLPGPRNRGHAVQRPGFSECGGEGVECPRVVPALLIEPLNVVLTRKEAQFLEALFEGAARTVVGSRGLQTRETHVDDRVQTNEKRRALTHLVFIVLHQYGGRRSINRLSAASSMQAQSKEGPHLLLHDILYTLLVANEQIFEFVPHVQYQSSQDFFQSHRER